MLVTDEKVKRVLEQCKRRVIKLTGRPISLVIFGYKEQAAFSYEDIANAVCGTMNVSYDRAITRSRKREVVIARQLIFFYARSYTKMSHRVVAEQLGYRDHSTSIHSISTIMELIDAKDSLVLNSIKAINQKLNIIL